MAGDHHVVGLAFGHARSNRADADFRHQLHADVGMRRHIFQVVDQLSQVFDRIDVVVRRGRNQAHTRHRMAQATDVVGHLAARQLTTLAGLGALGHLDLDLVCAAQILSGHTEAARGDLLDLGAHGVTCVQGVIHLKNLFTQEV